MEGPDYKFGPPFNSLDSIPGPPPLDVESDPVGYLQLGKLDEKGINLVSEMSF